MILRDPRACYLTLQGIDSQEEASVSNSWPPTLCTPAPNPENQRIQSDNHMQLALIPPLEW